MHIFPTEVFLDGHNRYEPREEPYEVDQERGAYFVSHRWATSPDLPDDWADQAGDVIPPVELQPDDVAMGHDAPEVS